MSGTFTPQRPRPQPSRPADVSVASRPQAPSPDDMRQACFQARQFWHRRFPDLAIRLDVAEVPRFVPGLGPSGETYRVGAIELVHQVTHLAVFLDVVARRILIEQPLLNISLDGGEAVDATSTRGC